MARSGEMTLAVAGRNFRLAEFLQELFVVEFAVEFIHFRHFFFQFLLVALREAAHYVELSESAFFLSLDKLQDGVDAFLLCILDEPACVDNGYLALRAL